MSAPLGHVPQALMPWAAVAWPVEQQGAVATELPTDAFSVRAAKPTLDGRGGHNAYALVARRAQFPSALSAAGLPYRPEPGIPEADRDSIEDEYTLRAAVVLDVLATWTKPLTASPAVLCQLAETLRRIANLGLAPEEDASAQLAATAASETASTRVLLSRRIHEALGTTAEAPALAGRNVCTPRSVAAALRRIERMAKIVVREAQLSLEAKDSGEFRQI